MQDNGELSGHRHPRFAIARSPGDGVPPILQARGFLEPRQDHDSSLVQQSTSECVAAPRYSAAAIDFARLILSRREPAPTDRDRLKRPGSSTVLTYASADSTPMPGTLMSSRHEEFNLTNTRIALSKTAICSRSCRQAMSMGRTINATSERSSTAELRPSDRMAKDWARAIARRSGNGKARVALVRKLSVILHSVWRSGKPFRWC